MEQSPEATFHTLVMSLACAAMQALDPPAPEPGKPPPPSSPELARPMIDCLEVLKTKTRGNLTPDETELLDSLLIELRVRYLKRTGGDSSPAPSAPAAPAPKPGPEPQHPC